MIKAVIFDLDGVIVSTDEQHYQAWQELANRYGIEFDRTDGERLRGVSRMECIEIMLEKSVRDYSAREKLAMAQEKNAHYVSLLDAITPANILPGIPKLLDNLSLRDVKLAIGSSSKNASYILKRIGLTGRFAAVADGNHIKKSKPDPEVFLLAANWLGIPPDECAVVEDAIAGIDAAIAAGCKAVAVGFAASYHKADYSVNEPGDLDINELLKECAR